jgi:hypothetical protein
MKTICTDVNWDSVLGPSLTEEQARRIYRQGEGAAVLAILKFAAKIEAMSRPSPTTLSAMIPPYQKPAVAKLGKSQFIAVPIRHY